MAKLSVPGLLSTLGAWYTGKREGELQRQQETQAQEQQTQRLALSLLPQFAQQYDQEQNRGRNDLMSLLQVPGLAPETQQQIAGQLFNAPQSQGPNPYGIGAQQNLLRQMPGGSKLPQFPSPGGGQVAPAGAGIVPKFRDPRQEQALSGVRSNTALYLKQAIDAGDTDAQNAISQLQTALDQQQVTPEQAGEQLRGIVGGLQSKGASSTAGKRLAGIQGDLERLLDKGTIRPGDEAAVSGLLGKIATVDLSKPEGVTQSAEVVQEYAKLRQKLQLQPPATVRESEARRKTQEDAQSDLATSRARDDDNQFRQRIAQAKTPEAKLRAIRAQRAFAGTAKAQGAGVIPYGEDDFDDTAREIGSPLTVEASPFPGAGELAAGPPAPIRETVTNARRESEPEINARLLKNAAEELPEGSDEKAKLLRGAFGQYVGLLKSSQFQNLPDAQRQQILGSVNELAEQLGLPQLPKDLKAGLSPRDKEYLENNKFQRGQALRRQKETERHNLETERQAGERETRLATAKTAVDKLSEGQKLKAQSLLTRMNQVHGALIKANAEVQEAIDAEAGDLVASRGKQAEDLAKQWEGLNKQFQQATGEAPPVSVKPAGATTAPKSDIRTVTVNGSPIRGTREQFFNAGRRGGKSDAELKKMWDSGK